MKFVIWQEMASPHMTGLAEALTTICDEVIFICFTEVLPERVGQGWRQPSKTNFRLVILDKVESAMALVEQTEDYVHITPGLRTPKRMGKVRQKIKSIGATQLAILEQIDPRGAKGVARKIYYQLWQRIFGSPLDGYLAIGLNCPSWLSSLGISKDKICPFAYFLPQEDYSSTSSKAFDTFKIVYAGRLVPDKGVEQLIEALSNMADLEFELDIYGSGGELTKLRDLADIRLPSRINFKGVVNNLDLQRYIAAADLLVLPSKYDGWGAVVSEALLQGTPVVCTSQCGASVAVQSCGVGGVYEFGDTSTLRMQLAKSIKNGKIDSTSRKTLRVWAERISARNGALWLTQFVSQLNSCSVKKDKCYSFLHKY